MTTREPFLLEPQFVERVWGKTDLRPWYDVQSENAIGEAWLTGDGCLLASGERMGERFAEVLPGYPLLVKMLFPREKLSVQVHPDDAEARAMGLERGKTECWYVLAAEPEARVACGLRPGVTVAEFAAAVHAGSAEGALAWLPVAQGDMVYVDAGTVHAIGPGVVLLEVQQTCDVTFRLYDYGRPRELHLEQGLAVIKSATDAGYKAPEQMDGFTRLIATRYFTVDQYRGDAQVGPGCAIALSGQLRTGKVSAPAGMAVICPEGGMVHGSELWVHCSAPELAG